MSRDELLAELTAERFGRPTPPPAPLPAGVSALYEILKELDGEQEQVS